MKQKTDQDIFLHKLYDQLHDSEMQRKFKRIHPWPVGVVFIERPGMSYDDIREQFRLMKKLGFNCLKQCCICPNTDYKKVLHLALDEGIIPWWYAEGGWENPTPELLTSIGIDPGISPAELRLHPAWLKRQEDLMRNRIDQDVPAFSMTAAHGTDGLPGTVKKFEYGLPEELSTYFVNWLQQQYSSVEELKKAWNFHHAEINHMDWQTWDDVEEEVIQNVNNEGAEYRRIRDVIRFKTDLYLGGMKRKLNEALELDPNVPVRAGGEMSLFLPFAMFSTDFEDIAHIMKDGGSFYPSIHASWHFEEVDFEFIRPLYMQSALANDWFKGGWAATWEATGGPQMLTGGKAPFHEPARNKIPGATIDGNTMVQLMLTWISAGFKGFGLWTWSTRTAGWEAGEYGLLDRDNELTDRAIAAGNIGKACTKYQDELWESHKEPVVGVFQDWDMDAIWAAASVGGRDFLKSMPVYARIGSNRALINANIPFEYVTAKNLRAGLANRYQVIYLPACLALDESLLDLFKQYVEDGGRLILDAPGGWYDYYGQLLSTKQGSPFEQLFGTRIANLQYSSESQRTWKIDNDVIDGFMMDLVPTSARVMEHFTNGQPAVTEHRIGKGSAVVMGYQSSLNCHKQGNQKDERRLVKHALGALQSPYSCDECVVYHLAAAEADHYFLLNDTDWDVKAVLQTEQVYRSGEDAITGETIEVLKPIEVPVNGGRWVRLLRA